MLSEIKLKKSILLSGDLLNPPITTVLTLTETAVQIPDF